MGNGKFLSVVGRILLSGLTAFLFLSTFCVVYYNIPTHVECEDGSTDYKWEAYHFYCRATEGFAWGRTNNDGYINAFDYSEGMPLEVLIMGSSHMEAFQLLQKESVSGRLNAMRGSESAYNIGISGHGFLTCVGNLEAALEKYQPKKYVAIEMNELSISDEALSRALAGSAKEIDSHAGGVLGLLQRNPYLRLLYAQIHNYRKQDSEQEELSAPQGLNNEKLLDELLEKIARTAHDADTNALIFYHPHMAVDSGGRVRFVDNPALSEQFAKCCEKNGVLFLDMRERFLREYESAYVLPHGFANTTVGAGHLNRYGHEMIAEELYRLIWGEI